MLPSRIQFSVTTELIYLSTELMYLRMEDLDYVTLCFTQHGAEVCKFFLEFFSNRETTFLSRKCVNLLSNTYGNDGKAHNLCEIPQNGQDIILQKN